MLRYGAKTWRGEDPTEDSPGKLPITFALDKGDMPMARLLLQLELCSSQDNHLLVSALRDAGAQVLNALFGSPARLSAADIADMLSLLAQAGLRSDQVEHQTKRTPLMLACQHAMLQPWKL
ncbi:hypothetical protein MMC07_000388 [Pseudocyphellaria aurata]|nr:hypothetical protein [Pseudocyphellaria aurata]